MDDRPVTLSTYPFELLRFRRFGPVTPAVQMGILAALYVATTLLFARGLAHRQDGGLRFGGLYLVRAHHRGNPLPRLDPGALEIAYGPARAVLASSVFFGLWHLKNVFWLSEYQLIHQMLYTALIFGPVTAVLALKTRTIWPGAILHYLNNLPAAVG
jgi:hypothetical protein